MTKEGVSGESIDPKKEADAQGISIANYIFELQSNIQSIRGLIAGSSSINTRANTMKNDQSGLNREKTMLRRGLKLPRVYGLEQFHSV